MTHCAFSVCILVNYNVTCHQLALYEHLLAPAQPLGRVDLDVVSFDILLPKYIISFQAITMMFFTC